MRTSSLLVIAATCVACAGKAEDQNDRFGSSSASVQTPEQIPGYVHSAARSRFHLGKNVRTISELGLEKVVGDEGTIATNPVTGSVRAILDATAPANDVPPLSSDEDVHTRAVVEYFKQAGLPVDQMGKPHVFTHMRGDGPTSDVSIATHPEFMGYTTYIPRVVEGIPVPDSFALARLNANGEATTEWVYWPPLPRSVVSDAQDLAARLAVAASRAAFLGLLAEDIRNGPGEVTIRHSDFDDKKQFVSFASYDLHVSPGPRRARGATLNFGLDGKEIIHPNRRPGDVPVPALPSKP